MVTCAGCRKKAQPSAQLDELSHAALSQADEAEHVAQRLLPGPKGDYRPQQSDYESGLECGDSDRVQVAQQAARCQQHKALFKSWRPHRKCKKAAGTFAKSAELKGI